MKLSVIITGAACALLIFSSQVQADTYWDHFKEPRSSGKDAAVPELIFSTIYVQPIGMMNDQVSMAAGASLGMFFQKRNFRYGLELSGLYSQGDEQESAGVSDRVTEYFIMAPFVAVIGYSFDLGGILSVVPFYGIGASLDLLNYMEEGLSPIGNTGTAEKWGVHPVQKPGVDIFINISSDIRFRIGAAYASLIEPGDSFEIAHMLMFGAGVSWRF